ncbi:MAG: beta-ketoacyl-ACP synthase II [Alphaproteobacteria bacterium]|nr:beta-ketoacyl-ACP synthase II [Alphaproteobacteria bacterium]
MRRVVVTGMGMLSPFGRGVEYNWNNIVAGKSAIRKIENIELYDEPVKIAGQVPMGKEAHQFDPDTVMEPKEQRRVDKFILFGLAAGIDAMEDSGWKPVDDEDSYRAGVMMGSGIGGLSSIYEMSTLINENKSVHRVSPFFIPSCLINMISGHLSIKFALKGPNHACVTACSTGTHAIGDASSMIARGDADLMLAGGAESAVNILGLSGFARMKAITADFNDEPEKASRPWDQARSGFVMGEGAGALVLEELEHAKKRGAKIYAEVVGYGMSGDAYHITAPSGDGAYRAMKMAVKHAEEHGVKLEDIGYVNAHGTSTPAGDVGEAMAVARLFGDNMKNVSMSSTKSAIGHLLGAAGAVEAVLTIKAINEQTCPPTLNLDNPAPEVEGMDLVPLKAKKREIKAAMSNSFGFGGTNSSIILKKYEG